MFKDHEQVTRMNEKTQSYNVKNEQNEGEAKVSGKRRVLLKGAMGVAPAVLTLRSGAAFSLSSAAAVCVQRDKVQGKFAEVLSPEPDNWYRVPVFCRTLTQDSGQSQQRLPPFKVYNVAKNATNGWYNENYDGNTITRTYEDHDSEKMKQTGTKNPFYTYKDEDEVYYILVQVNDEGRPTGLIGATSDGSTPYITGSCWSSATGGALLEDL